MHRRYHRPEPPEEGSDYGPVRSQEECQDEISSPNGFGEEISRSEEGSCKEDPSKEDPRKEGPCKEGPSKEILCRKNCCPESCGQEGRAKKGFGQNCAGEEKEFDTEDFSEEIGWKSIGQDNCEEGRSGGHVVQKVDVNQKLGQRSGRKSSGEDWFGEEHRQGQECYSARCEVSSSAAGQKSRSQAGIRQTTGPRQKGPIQGWHYRQSGF